MERSQLFKDLVISVYKWAKGHANSYSIMTEVHLQTTHLMVEAIFHSLPLEQRLAVEKYIAERIEEQ